MLDSNSYKYINILVYSQTNAIAFLLSISQTSDRQI